MTSNELSQAIAAARQEISTMTQDANRAHAWAEKRDMFAAAALNGLLASKTWHNGGGAFCDMISGIAYEMADAMMEARK